MSEAGEPSAAKGARRAIERGRRRRRDGDREEVANERHAAPTKAPPASGCLFVLAAPSGGGKTSLVAALLEREPGIRLSVSYTTRAPRPGETDGVHYHFVDEPRFLALKAKGEFLEHAYVHGHWYATSATWLSDQVAHGHDVLLEIDWQGAAQVRRLIPAAVHIFILPPSLALLRERLEKRGQDSPEVILRRLDAAREEMRHCARLRLCYYESGLCTSSRRPVRDRARGSPDRSAADGAPRASPAAIAGKLTDPEDSMARITIDDCLEKIPNRFELTLAATNRARQISAGSSPLRRHRPRQADRRRPARDRRGQGRHRDAAEGKAVTTSSCVLPERSAPDGRAHWRPAAMRHVGNRGVHPTPRQLPAAA